MIEQLYSQFKQPPSEFGFASILTWNGDFSERAVKRHAKLLDRAYNQNRKVWISFDKPTQHPVMRSLLSAKYALVFTDISIPTNLNAENVRNFFLARLPLVSAMLMQQITDTDKNLKTHTDSRSEGMISVFLRSEDNPAEPYYNITEYFVKCLSGDLEIASRLIGRTIFGIHYESQTERQSVDILSSGGVDALIAKGFEPYASVFKRYFGNTILGFCIEIPNFLSCEPANLNKLPWTLELPNYFSKVKDYNLLEMLPRLFYDSYDSASIRYDFWQVLTLMFAEVCVARLREWASKYDIKLALTQPLLARSLTLNLLPLFTEADVPAVHEPDVKSALQFSKRLILFKQATSVAGQFRKPYTLLQASDSNRTEASLVKWINDLHLSSIAGCNRFANSFSFDDSTSKRFDVYLRRLSYILSCGQRCCNLLVSCGQRCCNLLVINPIGSLWMKFGHKDYHWINSELASISETLVHYHHDFDFVDENCLAVFGQVRRRGKQLIIGDISYSAVLIPPCINLQEQTVDILRSFISARGKLIALEPLPYLMDCKAGDYAYPLERLLGSRRTTVLRGAKAEKLRQLESLLDEMAEVEIEIYARSENLKARSILKHHRKHENLAVCLLLNAGQKQIDALIEINGEFYVEEWNLENGEKYEPVQWHADNKTYVELQFVPWQARLLVIFAIDK
jgi:hypothetical protein